MPNPIITPQYTPAPYLIDSLLITAAQPVSYFDDFYLSLEYVEHAPVFVFERVVANLNGAFITAFKGLQDEVKDLKLSNDQLQGQLQKSQEGLQELKASHDEMKELVAVLQKPASTTNGQNNTSTEAQPTSFPTIGSFQTGGQEHDLKRNSRVVCFAAAHSAPPSLAIGITAINVDKQPVIRMSSYATDVLKKQFKINIDTWLDSVIYSGACTWLEIGPTDRDFQCGEFATIDLYPQYNPPCCNSKRVTFPREYSMPPNVVVWLSNIDMNSEQNWRLKTYASDITSTGFTIHIDTWKDSILYSAVATWVAYTADRPNLLSGTFNNLDMPQVDLPQSLISAYLNFPKGVFVGPPRVMVAISSFEIDCQKNLRLSVGVSSISSAGMEWKFDSAGDNILYRAGASYIALG